MKQIRNTLLLTFVVCFFVSCVGSVKPMTRREISSINFIKGLRQSEVETLLKTKPASFDIKYQEKSYLGQIYRVQVGISSIPQFVFTEYGTYSYPIHTPVLEDYVFVFENDRLLFWGLRSDLEKSDDDLTVHLLSASWERRVGNR